jgi:serine/threonine protein kinase
VAATLEQIVKQLTDSGIIASETLKDFIPPKADPKSPEELVQALVKSDKLTPLQAQHVSAGKARSLILGNYTIMDKIGAGGMGQVFKAQHRKMKRLVAIKMLPPSMTKDAAALARFQREVEAAAILRHPNIVAADDAAEANGAHFLVMEYVDGKDLSALVKKNGPFPVATAVNYILQAARGLEFAHSEGVVHRDIKPANLLLDKKGVVKILDMGLARLDIGGEAGPQDELTGTGTIMGTVDYMAPEQAVNTKKADHRADIYSLGISLHYLIVGKAPYTGDTVMEKLMAHQNQPIPSLRNAQPDIPERVQAVFKKMVAKKIEDRYQTMTEVVAELEGCLGSLGASTTFTGRTGPSTTAFPELDLTLPYVEQPARKPLQVKANPKLKGCQKTQLGNRTVAA